jgi:hypothetical protein
MQSGRLQNRLPANNEQKMMRRALFSATFAVAPMTGAAMAQSTPKQTTTSTMGPAVTSPPSGTLSTT